MLDREELSVRPNPVCTSSTTMTIVLVADPSDTVHELARRDEAAFALDGLDHDRCDRLGGDLRHERALERRRAPSPSRAAVVVRERHAVDLGRKRAEGKLAAGASSR